MTPGGVAKHKDLLHLVKQSGQESESDSDEMIYETFDDAPGGGQLSRDDRKSVEIHRKSGSGQVENPQVSAASEGDTSKRFKRGSKRDRSCLSKKSIIREEETETRFVYDCWGHANSGNVSNSEENVINISENVINNSENVMNSSENVMKNSETDMTFDLQDTYADLEDYSPDLSDIKPHGESQSVSSDLRDLAQADLDPDHPTTNSDHVYFTLEAPDSPPPPVVYRAQFRFTRQNSGDLSMEKGEQLAQVSADPGTGWTEVRNRAGQQGFVPTSYLQAEVASYTQAEVTSYTQAEVASDQEARPLKDVFDTERQVEDGSFGGKSGHVIHSEADDVRASESSGEVTSQGGSDVGAVTSAAAMFVVVFSFCGTAADDLSVEKGELVRQLEGDQGGWSRVQSQGGQQGYVPTSYIQPM